MTVYVWKYRTSSLGQNNPSYLRFYFSFHFIQQKNESIVVCKLVISFRKQKQIQKKIKKYVLKTEIKKLKSLKKKYKIIFNRFNILWFCWLWNLRPKTFVYLLEIKDMKKKLREMSRLYEFKLYTTSLNLFCNNNECVEG